MSGRLESGVISMVIFETFHHSEGEDKIELRTSSQRHRYLVLLCSWRIPSMDRLDTPSNRISGKTRRFRIMSSHLVVAEVLESEGKAWPKLFKYIARQIGLYL